MKSPILTIAISTFNRADRLEASVNQILREVNSLEVPSEVEILVVDNASTDETASLLKSLQSQRFRTIRNSTNQGMLGNLNVCVLRSSGEYFWCIGDDDFLIPGMLQTVLEYLRESNIPLIYVNYAHLLSGFMGNSDPLFRPMTSRLEESGIYPLQVAIQGNSNLMTAIYTMVIKRDEAISCYSVITHEDSFSTLASCVPTTVYALSLDPQTKVAWIASPVVAVDLRVSWIRFAPIWILERFPEMILRFLAWSEEEIDLRFIFEEMRPGIKHWIEQSYSSDYESPRDYRFLLALIDLYGDSNDHELRKEIAKLR